MENMEKQNIQEDESKERVNLESIFVPQCHTEEETEEKFVIPILVRAGLYKSTENNK